MALLVVDKLLLPGRDGDVNHRFAKSVNEEPSTSPTTAGSKESLLEDEEEVMVCLRTAVDNAQTFGVASIETADQKVISLTSCG